MNVLMPTTLVGSFPQPNWLVRRDVMLTSAPPRVRLKKIWRVEEPYLEEAHDDATAQAVRMQEAAGIDIITDGEIRRESYFQPFRQRARRHRHRQSSGSGGASRHAPDRAARDRGNPPHTPGAGARCRSPAGPDQQTDQDHGARSFHDDAARQGRVLWRQARAADGLREGGERRQAPTSSSWMSRSWSLSSARPM